MGISYDSGITATVDVMTTHILSHQGQSQTNAVKEQDNGNSVLGPVLCFAGGLYTRRNNVQLRSLPYNSTEASKSITKNQWRGMLSNGVLVFHDNARPHTS
ncbi:hypothetical protein TNCV_2809271 [Trichonephila clavipes]|nr:hypothetical protein TNCV_2809271 [Trichonephila clavipes]